MKGKRSDARSLSTRRAAAEEGPGASLCRGGAVTRKPPSGARPVNCGKERVLGEWFHEYGGSAKLTGERVSCRLATGHDVRRHGDDGYARHRLPDAGDGQACCPVGRRNIGKHEVARAAQG